MNSQVSPNLVGEIAISKVEFLRYHDLIKDIAEGQDTTYRADEAKATLGRMSVYLTQVFNVNEQEEV